MSDLVVRSECSYLLLCPIQLRKICLCITKSIFIRETTQNEL